MVAFKRINIVHNHKFTAENLEWRDKLEKLSHKIQLSLDKKKANYSLEKIDLLGHLTFDLLTLEDQIVSFCGLYSGNRFQPGVYRALNRCYVFPQARTKKIGNFSNLNSTYLLPLQLIEFSDAIKFCFISREGKRGNLFLQKWQKLIKTSEHWSISNNLIHVAPHSQKSSAYQYICYKGPSHFLNGFHQISPREWETRYENK